MKHFTLLVIIFILGCQSKNSKELREAKIKETETAGNYTVEKYLDDTLSVHFVLSGIEYHINYFENKPQYIRIAKFEKLDSTILSYEWENRGIFIGLSDSLKFLSMGYKYLYGNEILKCHLDTFEKMDYLEIKNRHYNDTLHIIDLKNRQP